MTNELFSKDHPLLMERLGRLLGSTTYRDAGSGGGTPFSARKMTAEAKLILGLKLGQAYPGDVGPWIVYSIALQIDDREREIVTWLAKKLEAGTGHIGQRNANRMLVISHAAYGLAVHGVEPKEPRIRPKDYIALVNIGAGWLWTKAECTVDRVEVACSKAVIAA